MVSHKKIEENVSNIQLNKMDAFFFTIHRLFSANYFEFLYMKI